MKNEKDFGIIIWVIINMHFEKKENKLVILGIGSFLLYMFLQQFQILPLQIFHVDISAMSPFSKILYLSIYEIIFFMIIVFLFKDKLKKDFEDVKKNHQMYFKKYLKYWFLAIGIMMISNLLINMVHPGVAGNQEAVLETFDVAPIYMFLSAVVFAPVVEELIFRQGFRYIFKNDFLFVLFSGFVFGGLHVFSSITSGYDILYLIPYAAPGVVFAYVLTECDNIFVPMGLHFLHNGIQMSLLVFMTFFL